MTDKEKVRYLEEVLKISTNTFRFGLLELSAWMGIPEKKRMSAIKEIISNYEFWINHHLEKVNDITKKI
jgi:hypothetical protein